MFLIRQAKLDDAATLLKLAKMVHFINLPADREVITSKILRSRECFRRAAGVADATPDQPSASRNGAILGLSASRSDLFMLVLEDADSGACLGSSQIISRMGGPGNPNFSMRLTRRDFFSQSLQTGTSHVVARLHADESGPTEIGGLILQPASRGHRLGRFLSFVRFHLIALHRHLFADRVIAEMMGPLSADGRSPLWEFFGRRFIPLSYTEADSHCQRSREFISALLPAEDIYLSLLPPEARDVVGRVGEETVPARAMLERLGFTCKDLVDPFDGGPHLEASTDDISIVRNTRRAILAGHAAEFDREGIVSHLSDDGEFRAIQTPFALAGDQIRLPRDAIGQLEWKPGLALGVTPYEAARKRAPQKTTRTAEPKPPAKPATKRPARRKERA
ncbi:MAG: arginine N-succinyltransferase [Phycisphaerae bacterium]|nr:arginine N-succinyltransferase [Phycisphaerae bacterium]